MKTKAHMHKKITALLLAVTVAFSGIVLMTESAYAATSSVKTLKASGYAYPEAFGKAKLTTKKIAKLAKEKDPAAIQKSISTVPDCINYFRKAAYYFDGRSGSGYNCIKNHHGDSYGMSEAMAYILKDDYPEIGTIEVKRSEDDFEILLYLKKGSYYYLLNPVSYSFTDSTHKKWMGGFKTSGTYKAKSLTTITKSLKKSFKTVTVTEIYSKAKTVETQILGGRNYTSSEIKNLAAQNLTLDEARDKLSTIYDVVAYLQAKEFRFGYSKTPCMDTNDGMNWVGTLSPQFTFEKNAGVCSNVSGLVNYLLKDDYDSEGIVYWQGASGGHVFNYFYQDGKYYFFDCVGMLTGTIFDGCEAERFVMFSSEDPMDFAEYYRTKGSFSSNYDNLESGDYALMLSMVESDGEGGVIRAFRCKAGGEPEYATPDGHPVDNIYPTGKEGKVIFLYNRYNCPIEYADLPDASLWPAETDANYADK